MPARLLTPTMRPRFRAIMPGKTLSIAWHGPSKLTRTTRSTIALETAGVPRFPHAGVGDQKVDRSQSLVQSLDRRFRHRAIARVGDGEFGDASFRTNLGRDFRESIASTSRQADLLSLAGQLSRLRPDAAGSAVITATSENAGLDIAEPYRFFEDDYRAAHRTPMISDTQRHCAWSVREE